MKARKLHNEHGIGEWLKGVEAVLVWRRLAGYTSKPQMTLYPKHPSINYMYMYLVFPLLIAAKIPPVISRSLYYITLSREFWIRGEALLYYKSPL